MQLLRSARPILSLTSAHATCISVSLPSSTLAFTICFSSFLLLFVNWHSILFCDSNCDDIVGFRSDAFSKSVRTTHPSEARQTTKIRNASGVVA